MKHLLFIFLDFLIRKLVWLRSCVVTYGIKYKCDKFPGRKKPSAFTLADYKVINRFLDENGYPQHLHISKQKNDNA